MQIKVTTAQLNAVDNFLRQHKKIDAIKFVRDTGRPPGPILAVGGGVSLSTISLKEAKDAVEHREWHIDCRYDNDALMGSARRGVEHADSQLVLRQPIRRIICDFGSGEIELDMDGLSLRAMSGLNGSMKIEDALDLIDLFKRIKDWDTRE